MDTMPMSEAEAEVRRALAAYKLALVQTGYRGVWHRLMCRMGDQDARNADKCLKDAEANTRLIANASEEHKQALRLVSSQQPEHVRAQDRFLDLIQNT